MLRKLALLWSPLVAAWALGFGGFASTFLAGRYGGPDHWLALWGLVAFLLSAPIGALGFGSAIAAVGMALRIDPDGDDVLQRNVLWLNAPLLFGMSLLWLAVFSGLIGGTFFWVAG